jgi:hypothetical protein
MFLSMRLYKHARASKGKIHQAFMWVLVGVVALIPYNRIYEFFQDRKYSNDVKLLSGYTRIIHSNKNGGTCQSKTNRCSFAHIRPKIYRERNRVTTFDSSIIQSGCGTHFEFFEK